MRRSVLARARGVRLAVGLAITAALVGGGALVAAPGAASAAVTTATASSPVHMYVAVEASQSLWWIGSGGGKHGTASGFYVGEATNLASAEGYAYNGCLRAAAAYVGKGYANDCTATAWVRDGYLTVIFSSTLNAYNQWAYGWGWYRKPATAYTDAYNAYEAERAKLGVAPGVGIAASYATSNASSMASPTNTQGGSW